MWLNVDLSSYCLKARSNIFNFVMGKTKVLSKVSLLTLG